MSNSTLNQHHADAHAGFERNLIDRIRFAAKPANAVVNWRRCLRGCRTRRPIASPNSNQAEQQNDGKRGADRLSGTGDKTPKYSTMMTAMNSQRKRRNLPE